MHSTPFIAMTAAGLLAAAPSAAEPSVPCGDGLRINEIRVRHPGGGGPDFQEYFELQGPAGLDLSCYCYIVLGPGAEVDELVRFPGVFMPSDGLLLVAQPSFDASLFPGGSTPDLVEPLNFLNPNNRNHLLVRACDGLPGIKVGSDLDQDDDGVLDSEPWECVADCITLLDDPADPIYCPVKRGPTAGGLHPPHVYRCRLPGRPLRIWRKGPPPLPAGGGLDTPGMPNPLCPMPTIFGGLPHLPLDGGILSIDGKGLLVITNLDDSGDDGTATLMSPSIRWSAVHQDLPSTFDDGDSWTVRAVGTAFGVADYVLASHTLHRVGDDAVVTADFPILGVDAPITVEVWNAGAMVGRAIFTDQRALEVVIPSMSWTGSPAEDWDFIVWDEEGAAAEAAGGLTSPVCIWEKRMSTPMTVVVQGQSYDADRLRIMPLPPGSVDGGLVWHTDRIETVTSGIDFEVQFEAEVPGVMFAGMPLQRLGTASLTREADAWQLEGADAAAGDGVLARFGRAGTACVETLTIFDFIGGEMLAAAFAPPPTGLGPGESDTVWMTKPGIIVTPEGVPQIIAEFVGPLAGVPQHELLLELDGQLVHAEVAPGASAVLSMAPQPGAMLETVMCTRIVDRTPQMSLSFSYAGQSDPIPVVTASGFQGLADTLVVRPIGAGPGLPPIDAVGEAMVTASGLPLVRGTSITRSPAPPVPCPADIDGDDGVGFSDLLAVLAAFGPGPSAADLDGDGDVDFDDVLTILAAWGEC